MLPAKFEQRHVDHAVAHVDRRADLDRLAADLLQLEHGLVEFRGLLEIFDADGDVAQTGHRVLRDAVGASIDNRRGKEISRTCDRMGETHEARRAEIVGAGFAGLAAACALAQRGWPVRVHERADRLRTTGAGIYVYENGLRVLEALGAYADAIEGAPFANTREVRDDHNRVVSVHRWDSSSRVFSIVRQQVINALAAAAARHGAEI